MSPLQGQVPGRSGGCCRGGIISYPLESIYKEVAYIAYHFHWELDTILEMEHRERAIFIQEIAAINERINAESGRD